MASNKDIMIRVKFTPDLSDLQIAMKKINVQPVNMKFNNKEVLASLNQVQEASRTFISSLKGDISLEGLKSGYADVLKSIENARIATIQWRKDAEAIFNSPENQKSIKQIEEMNKQLDALQAKRNKAQVVATTKKSVDSQVAQQGLTGKSVKSIQAQIDAILNDELAITAESQKQVVHYQEQIALLKQRDDLNRQRSDVSAADYVGTPTAIDREIRGVEAQKAEIPVKVTAEQIKEVIVEVDELGKGFGDLGTAATGTTDKMTGAFQEQAKVQKEAKKETKDLMNVFSGTFLGVSLSGLTSKIFDSSIRFYKEMDAILTRTMMVTGKTREEVNGLTDSYAKMAQQLSSTIKDVAAAQLVFYQQGLATKEAAQMTEAAIAISKTGGIEAAEAADRLTAAVKGYQLASTDAMNIADKMSALDAAAASSVDELTVAMQKSASQAKMAGLDLDYYMAYLSTMQEVTREAPENIG